MGPNWELISDAINSTLHLKVGTSTPTSSVIIFIDWLWSMMHLKSLEQNTVVFIVRLFSVSTFIISPLEVFLFVFSLFFGSHSDWLCNVQCIFRKPKECKERHKILMDLNTGDGADSAEDSGSSQPYPSTIPGIPKARVFNCSPSSEFFLWSTN